MSVKNFTRGKCSGNKKREKKIMGKKEPKVVTAEQVAGGVKPLTQVIALEAAAISPSPNQTRRDFDEDALKELADSIRANGILQPVTVRRIDAGVEISKFELVAGERRLRAAKLAGLRTVPAIVVKADDSTAAALTALENMQRKDLTPAEEAQGVIRLRELGLTLEDCASKLGKSRTWVQRREKLSALLPEDAAAASNPKEELSKCSLEQLEILADMAGFPEIYREIKDTLCDDLEWPKRPDALRRAVQEHSFIFSGGRGKKFVAFSGCEKAGKDAKRCPYLREDGNKSGRYVCWNRECYKKKAEVWNVNEIARIKESAGKDGSIVTRLEEYSVNPYLKKQMEFKNAVVYKWAECEKEDDGAKKIVEAWIGGDMLLEKKTVWKTDRVTEKEADEEKKMTPEERAEHERRVDLKRMMDGVAAWFKAGNAKTETLNDNALGWLLFVSNQGGLRLFAGVDISQVIKKAGELKEHSLSEVFSSSEFLALDRELCDRSWAWTIHYIEQADIDCYAARARMAREIFSIPIDFKASPEDLENEES